MAAAAIGRGRPGVPRSVQLEAAVLRHERTNTARQNQLRADRTSAAIMPSGAPWFSALFLRRGFMLWKSADGRNVAPSQPVAAIALCAVVLCATGARGQAQRVASRAPA